MDVAATNKPPVAMHSPSHDAAYPRQHAVQRARLTRRLARASPRIIAAIAPAGYAKSTVVRAYAQTLPSYALCDCEGVRGSVDLAQRLAAALARGDARREREVARQRIAAPDDVSMWGHFALELWLRPSEHPLVVLENVEHTVDSVEQIDFIARLLAHLPVGRQLAICSRRPLPLSLSRFVAPHELASLREDELRFDRGDIRAAFAGLETATGTLEEVARVTRGWPVAVLLFARLAREGVLESALEHSSEVAYSDLYDYLAEQVLASLRPHQLARLLAVASIPRATPAEVALVLDDPSAAEELAALARSSPFVYRVLEGALEAHPLVRAMFQQRYGEQCRQTLLRASERLAPVEPLRAAELYLEAGDDERAAALLESQHELFVSDLPPLFAGIIARLDERTVLRHAGLWAAATAVRASAIPQRQWLYEALGVRERLPAETPLGRRVGVLTSLGNVLTNLGRHDEALEVFEQFAPPGVELPERYQAIQRLFRSAVAARQGHFAAACALWGEAEPLFAGISMTQAIALEEVVARAARFTGSREEERAVLDRAVALAHQSGVPAVRVLALQEALFGAWFAGDDGLTERLARELEDTITPSTARSTEVLRACMRGDVELLLRGDPFERPRFRHYAALIACAGADPAQRAELARIALEEAEHANDATCVAVACIVCAECGTPEQAVAFVERAHAQCALTDASRLRDAVDAYLQGSRALGVLAPLLRRLRGRAVQGAVVETAPCAISVIDASVRRNGRSVSLSKRERELLFYLALHPRPCGREELLEALWPGSVGYARSVLRVYVSRVRARLADAGAVRLLDSGEYRLSGRVRVDLHDIERLAQRARAQSLLTADTRARLEAYVRRWSGEVAPVLGTWEWFAPLAPRVEDLFRQIVLLLGNDALRRGRLAEARALAERIVALDRCDEPARELLIRAVLAAGDGAGARRELRKYREILERELGAKPSGELERLVEGQP
ncbi:hypothetical protein EPN52_11440 [bacterium]|nr:MAG: hypothetical protein EPN52_11440 [bacterium]